MHSGWGALVAIAGDASTVEVIDRRRIVTAGPEVPGAKQPYHFASKFEVPEAERYLTHCADVSERLAHEAVSGLMAELHLHDYRLVGSAILLASGRPLPTLSTILASHALIHAAEGELFRRAFWRACEGVGLRVMGVRERDLDQEASALFGRATPRMRRRLASVGQAIGPPWTKDQKTAALAAAMVLWRSGVQ
ncbi:MAG: hypothetical protein NVS4B3_10740 [Gemmatimonadaceae bacterium]